LFELRRREPGNDLTTHLVQAEENGNKLTNEELAANIILLFGAGHETTVNLIGNGLLALHRNPDQLRLLRSDPSLMANAIEELLRYDSSVQVTGRTTLEDVDEIGGIPLEKGQSVVCLLGSANRDPAIYPDPDRLDITRRDVRPLSFGGGIHYCVGAQPALRARFRLRRCCVACPNCGLIPSIIPIGGRHLSCAASTSSRPVGRSIRSGQARSSFSAPKATKSA
jgi:cytochrome P450